MKRGGCFFKDCWLSSKKKPPAFQPVESLNNMILTNYKLGTPLNSTNGNVFVCKKLQTRVNYVCKVSREMPRFSSYQPIPMEAQVYKVLKQYPHNSLAQIHELVEIRIRNEETTYVEVIEYFSPNDGWIDLSYYIARFSEQTTISSLHYIFKQVVAGIFHLYRLGISHSDIKGINVNLS
jgi:serine/threonine protein kinase